MDRFYLCPWFWTLRSCPSLSSQCLSAPILVVRAVMHPNSQSSGNWDLDNSSWHTARGTSPSPKSLKSTLHTPPVEQHTPHSSPSSTLVCPLPCQSGSSRSISTLPTFLPLLPHLPNLRPPLHTGIALSNPPQSPPIPDPTIAPPFSVLSRKWWERMALSKYKG